MDGYSWGRGNSKSEGPGVALGCSGDISMMNVDYWAEEPGKVGGPHLSSWASCEDSESDWITGAPNRGAKLSGSSRQDPGCWAENKQGRVKDRAVPRGLGPSRWRSRHMAGDVNSRVTLSVLNKVHRERLPFLIHSSQWVEAAQKSTDR